MIGYTLSSSEVLFLRNYYWMKLSHQFAQGTPTDCACLTDYCPVIKYLADDKLLLQVYVTCSS